MDESSGLKVDIEDLRDYLMEQGEEQDCWWLADWVDRSIDEYLKTLNEKAVPSKD